MIHVPVGPYTYQVSLSEDYPRDAQGRRCRGTCDPERQQIIIYRGLSPAKRIATLWHELGHAWAAELDIHEARELGPEPMSNLIGLAMAGMSARQLAALHTSMLSGVEAHDVVLLGNQEEPIPVIDLSPD